MANFPAYKYFTNHAIERLEQRYPTVTPESLYSAISNPLTYTLINTKDDFKEIRETTIKGVTLQAIYDPMKKAVISVIPAQFEKVQEANVTEILNRNAIKALSDHVCDLEIELSRILDAYNVRAILQGDERMEEKTLKFDKVLFWLTIAGMVVAVASIFLKGFQWNTVSTLCSDLVILSLLVRNIWTSKK